MLLFLTPHSHDNSQVSNLVALAGKPQLSGNKYRIAFYVPLRSMSVPLMSEHPAWKSSEQIESLMWDDDDL